MPVARRLTTDAGKDFAAALREEERAAAERRRAFKEGFRRSKRGNLWRKWTNKLGVEITFTVYRCRDGWGWCAVGPGGQKDFSERVYDSEDAALTDLTSLM
jgi:hypothetical protein